MHCGQLPFVNVSKGAGDCTNLVLARSCRPHCATARGIALQLVLLRAIRVSACEHDALTSVSIPPCCGNSSCMTGTAQDARLILTAPEPALAECLIPPSAALAYEAHMRSSDAGASAASWDLAAAQPRVRPGCFSWTGPCQAALPGCGVCARGLAYTLLHGLARGLEAPAWAAAPQRPVSCAKRRAPFVVMACVSSTSCGDEALACTAAQAIELKEAAQNPLLGAHHLEARGRFVSAVTPGLSGAQRVKGSTAGAGEDRRDSAGRAGPGRNPSLDPDRGGPHAAEELDWDGEEGDASGSELGSPRLGQGALGELRSVTQVPRERHWLGAERAAAG